METNQEFLNSLIDKQIVVYLYNPILLSTEIHYGYMQNVNKPQKYSAE
jgi:hypothetical protein